MSGDPILTGKVIGVWAYVQGSSDHFGGVETQVVRLCKELGRLGATVILHCLSNSSVGWHVRAGSFQQGPNVVIETPNLTVFRPANGPGTDGCVQENVLVAEQFAEEFVLAFGTRDGYVFQVAAAGARELRVPLISFIYFTQEEREYRSQLHERTRSIAGLASPSERDQLIARSELVVAETIEASDVVVVPTSYVQSQLLAIVPHAATKTAVVYHGVDDTFDSASNGGHAAPRHGWLHVSRLSLPYAGHKNFFWSMEAIREACRQDPNIVLQVIGAGDAVPLLSQFIEANELERNVQITGQLLPLEVARKFATSKMLLVPSMMEAGSTTTVEAVLSGCLPIGAESAALPELFASLGLSEYLLPVAPVQRGSVGSLEPKMSEAVERLLEWDANIHNLAPAIAEAQAVARQKYHVKATTRQLVDLLAEKGVLR